jgi:prophage regulatory protein
MDAIDDVSNRLAPGRKDRLLPFAAALRLVGVGRSKAYELLAAGDFPRPVKLGTRNFFSEQEIQAWIALRLAERGPIGDSL